MPLVPIPVRARNVEKNPLAPHPVLIPTAEIEPLTERVPELVVAQLFSAPHRIIPHLPRVFILNQ
jgi:hypothetical protein